MLLFFKQCGLYGFPLIILAIVNCILILVSVKRIAGAKPEDAPVITGGINAILFWGAVSAVLGFLGQHTGLYNALSVIGRAQKISPNLVAQGFAESFTTTIFGMTILIFSALAWFILHGWYHRVAASREK